MISQRTELPIVAFSVRVYQALLVAYPTKFQQEYGSQMVQVFQDCCLRALRQGGTNGMLKLWAITLLDLVQSVITVHSQKEVQMKNEINPEDIRKTGISLMIGGITFVLALYTGFFGDYTNNLNLWTVSFFLLILLGMPGLVVGLLGVRNRYGEKAGGFGKTILLIGAILGSVTSISGVLLATSDRYGILVYAGPAVLLAGLAVFGIVALYKKPLPRWNVVPLIAGFWYPLFIFIPMITSVKFGDPVMSIINYVLLLIQGVALVALGYILKSNTPEEIAVPA